MIERERIYTLGLIRTAELELAEAVSKLDEGQSKLAAECLRKASEYIDTALALHL